VEEMGTRRRATAMGEKFDGKTGGFDDDLMGM